MAINFPDSPTNGQVATIGGKNYTYNSTKNTWTPTQVTEADLSSVGSTTVVATHDLLPSSPSAGDMALVSSVNKMYVYFLSGWWLMSSLQNASPSGITGNAAIYELATDGTPTTVTLSSSDPEGFPISWSHSVISGSLGGTTVTNVDNVFTITPSTDAADAGTFTLRFAAADGQGGEVGSQSNFTLDFVFIVADSRYTTLLATAVDTSDNNNITDTSTNNHSITVNGDAHAGTFSPYRSGGYSTYFDGTGDYLRTPTINLSGDFTIQFFVNLNAITTDVGIFSFGTLTSTNSILELYNNTSGQFRLYSSSGGELGASSAAEANKWYHVAITRSGNTFKAYLDGVEFADDTTARTINSAITIGGYVNTSYLMNGHIRDFRITTNVEYPSNNFTPPSEPLTAITGTVLLACHLPYIADGSTNDHSITVNNDVSTKPFSPYDYNEYSATNNGGSVYFDRVSYNSGGYVTVADHNDFTLGTSDWTVKFWVYHNELDTSAGTAYGYFSNYYFNTPGGFGLKWMQQWGNKPVLEYMNSGSYAKKIFDFVPSAKIWYYYELTCSSSTVTFKVNGDTIGTQSVPDLGNPDRTLIVGAASNGSSSVENILGGYIADFQYVTGGTASESSVPISPMSTNTNSALHIKGTDASIIDKSQSANLKLVGNTTGSTTQVKFAGTKSMYFDGSGDYIQASLTEDNLPNEFTIEGWVYTSTVSGPKGIFGIDTTAFPSTDAGIAVFTRSSTYNHNYAFYCNGNQVNSTTLPTANTWQHFALVRNSSNLVSLYLDGSSIASSTISGTVNGSIITIGGYYSSSYLWNGYIQDFRITKGLARYTANFTPPTASLEG